MSSKGPIFALRIETLFWLRQKFFSKIQTIQEIIREGKDMPYAQKEWKNFCRTNESTTMASSTSSLLIVDEFNRYNICSKTYKIFIGSGKNPFWRYRPTKRLFRKKKYVMCPKKKKNTSCVRLTELHRWLLRLSHFRSFLSFGQAR